MRLLPFFLILILGLSSGAQAQEWTRIGMGGGGWFMCSGAGPTGIILVGSDLSGAYRSVDGGNSWDVLGPNRGQTASHIRSVNFDPLDGDIMYLGSNSGIFRSADGGDNFQHVMTGGTITDVRFSPQNPDIGYAIHHPQYDGFDAEFYRSADRGLTWSKDDTGTGLPDSLRFLKIILHPSDPDSVFMLSGKDRFKCGPAHLYASGDAGEHWEQLAIAVSDTIALMDFAVDPWDQHTMYLTTMNTLCDQQYYVNANLKGDFLKSTDGGITWIDPNPLDNEHSGAILIDYTQPGHIRTIDPRLTAPWKSRSGTFLSTDYGSSWTQIGDENNWDIFYLEGLLPDENVIHTVYSGSGVTCRTIGENLSDPLAYFWTNSRFVYKSSDGGVLFESAVTHQSPDGGWSSTGIDNVNLYDLEVSPANPDVVYAGYADNGLWRSLNGGATWNNCNTDDLTSNWNGLGGNTVCIAADPDRPAVVWATLQGSICCYNANLVRSDAHGDPLTWQTSNAGLPVTKKIYDLTVDPNSPIANRVLFAVVEGDVYKSSDDGYTWALSFDQGKLFFVEVDPMNSNRIFAGGVSGLFRTLNAGLTWQQIGTEFFTNTGNTYHFISKYYRGISCIHPSSCEDGILYVTAYGEGKGLYKSNDAGNSFTKILDGDFMRAIAVSKTNHNKLYLGSSYLGTNGGTVPANPMGFLYSHDGGNNWTDLSNTLEFPSVSALKSNGQPNERIYAISQGTGPMYLETDNQPFFYYLDEDADGFGNPVEVLSLCFSSPPLNYVRNDEDCDDLDPEIHPNAAEIFWNGIDENCDGKDLPSLYPVGTPINTISVLPGRKRLIVENSSKGIFELWDVKGSRLLKLELTDGEWNLDLSEFNSGIYIVRIMGTQGIDTQKIFLE